MKQIYLGLLALFLVACNNNDKVTESALLAKGISLDLAEFRAEQLSNIEYHLTFDIPESLDAPVVSKLKLEANILNLQQPLILDFNADKSLLLSVNANGSNIDIKHENEHLIIDTTYLKQGKNTIGVAFNAGELSLNRNKEYLYTLLVPDRASTLFPCFDQPDLKAVYHLNIAAPKEWNVLCGALLKDTIEEENKTKHIYNPTDKMSTYLFSFVAGAFETTQKTIDDFKMNLLYRETDSTKVTASIPEIFRLHYEAVRFLEDYTDYKFPFQKLDFATIPGFQYGGMEHVGAIQYRESTLFLDETATKSSELGRGKLIAHEVSHMWFGDLVTMKWFNDVWMKEVFANFMADKIANPSFPELNHDLQFVLSHYSSAYAEDRTKGATSIRQHLDNLKNAGSLYGNIIYNKAPIMMRQLEATMGKQAFQEGIQEYIKTYANGNADWNELVAILDKKTDIDMKAWSDVWVNQSGRPIITDNVTYDSNNTISKFKIVQKAEDKSDKIWPQQFEIGLVYTDSIHVINVGMQKQDVIVEEAVGLPKPLNIIYNFNGFGYGVFPVQQENLDAFLNLENEVARGYSYINLYEKTLNNDVSTIVAFNLFKRAILEEQEEVLVRLVSGKLQSIFWTYLTQTQRESIQETLETDVRQRLEGTEESGIKKTLFGLYRSIAYSDKGRDFLYAIWNKTKTISNLKLNKDDYTNLASTLALYNHPETQNILKTAETEITNQDKLERFQFLLPSLSNNEATRDKLFESFKDADNRAKESWVLRALGNIHHPLRQASGQKHLNTSLELLEEIQLTGDIFFPKRWLSSTVGRYNSAYAKEVIETFLRENPDFSPILKNKLFQAADPIFRAQTIFESTKE
ncbi:M1 family aminopeptidase [Flavobacteriaceae bacterium S0825]|uniref:M1 family metallopeptidase n=1 Tax=Gaetbulibacter sp. S0825 TaxID=2720084 RepID=UPI0014317A0E|nr:M1 family aminopeptidase [Gaetbulibacter sp. S0825]MCK0107918.1 M1 family aminopeptidase [Flavobacteriaceae bacterium S0825]NIX63554.1 peptidase M1 [Gaetbulibacter sp. S0825]